jgi:hypothetical protein
VRKYGVMPFLRLLVAVLVVHTSIKSFEKSIIDVQAVKEIYKEFIHPIDSHHSKSPYSSSYCPSSIVDQLTQTLLEQSINDNNPITAFLRATDKKNNNCYQTIVMEKVLEQQPAALSIFAEYFLQKQSWFGFDEQQFIQDWKDSLQRKKEFTQTCAHLSTKGLRKPLEFFTKHYQPQLIKAGLKERELNDQGYTVFYHGQQSFFGFYQDFCRKLLLECFNQGVVTYKLPDDFFFVRIPSSLKDLMNNDLSEAMQQKEFQKRNNIMNGHHDYNNCLSVNGSLFGSTGTGTSSTWKFVVDNSNCGRYSGPDLGMQIFAALGYQFLFKNFELSIKKLLKEYTQFFNVGRLLQIAVPAYLVDECAFISSGSASKTSVDCGQEGGVISKISEQMSYCKKRDRLAYGYGSSENHYCVVMTEDMALNPRSGIKYFSYDGKPKEEITFHLLGADYRTVTYSEHCAKVDQLVCDIVQHLKNQENSR